MSDNVEKRFEPDIYIHRIYVVAGERRNRKQTKVKVSCDRPRWPKVFRVD